MAREDLGHFIHGDGGDADGCDLLLLQSMFRACDSSGDNKVSLEEYLTAMGELPPTDHK